VAGDVIAAGEEVTLSSKVSGDAVLAGREVHIDGDAGQNVYAAGSEVALNAAVGRNVRIAAGRVDIGRHANILGNASLAGGRVNVAGDIKGYVQAAGGRVYINGAIGGDVEISGREVALGPNARVSGALRYRSPDPIAQDPHAVVGGGIERLTMHRPPASLRTVHRVGRWIWAIGLAIVAALSVAAMPRFSMLVSQRVTKRFLSSLLLAFLVVFCAPVAAIALLVTGIGAPLGMLVALAWPTLLLLGYVGAGIALGDAILRGIKPIHATAKRWRTSFAALGALVISLTAWIPWIGGFVAIIALLVGVGALVSEAWSVAIASETQEPHDGAGGGLEANR